MKIWFPVVIVFLYGADCALNLFSCVPPEKRSIRFVTKCLLMPLLALCYLLGAEVFSPLVLVAILCGFLGDIFLLYPERTRLFVCGLAAFSIGHIFYSIHMLRLLAAPPAWWVAAIAALAYLAAVAFTMRMLKGHLPTGFTLPCFAYMVLISFMSFCSLMLLISRPSLYSALVFAGSLLFILSDTVLALNTFEARHDRYHNLIVMATYIMAQTLIVNGLMYM